ncbi:hypothetical protein NDU88_001954 [Pleurodeles waltl]|uniref:Uncharacterized protein n=1 Tax=Pleurodeles waltl TaxID=8319 RepID=A0AAV7RBC7_PLEWA|nr:hypothetical protein NDU88_001954 [Pleurodeles waltl]
MDAERPAFGGRDGWRGESGSGDGEGECLWVGGEPGRLALESWEARAERDPDGIAAQLRGRPPLLPPPCPRDATVVRGPGSRAAVSARPLKRVCSRSWRARVLVPGASRSLPARHSLSLLSVCTPRALAPQTRAARADEPGARPPAESEGCSRSGPGERFW